MNFKVEIDIMPLEEILDPQGKVVNKSLDKMGINGVSGVRIGKHVKYQIEATNEADASAKVEASCKKLLANLIMESYSYSVTPV